MGYVIYVTQALVAPCKAQCYHLSELETVVLVDLL